MTRSGYVDDLEPHVLNLWRGAVASSIRGKRGQRLLRDTLAALDAMPVKRLIGESLSNTDGEVCTLGCAARARAVDVADIDFDYDEDSARDQIACRLDVADCLAQEIMYMNDEAYEHLSPEARWMAMRAWVARRIIPTPEEQDALSPEER